MVAPLLDSGLPNSDSSQAHCLLHTRVVEENLIEGGTFWGKEAGHLTEEAAVYRQREKGEALGPCLKASVQGKALGLDLGSSWR